MLQGVNNPLSSYIGLQQSNNFNNFHGNSLGTQQRKWNKI